MQVLIVADGRAKAREQRGENLWEKLGAGEGNALYLHADARPFRDSAYNGFFRFRDGLVMTELIAAASRSSEYGTLGLALLSSVGQFIDRVLRLLSFLKHAQAGGIMIEQNESANDRAARQKIAALIFLKGARSAADEMAG